MGVSSKFVSEQIARKNIQKDEKFSKNVIYTLKYMPRLVLLPAMELETPN